MLAPGLEGRSNSSLSFLFLSRLLLLPSPSWGPFSAIDTAQECPGTKEGGYKGPSPSHLLHSHGSPSAYLRKGLKKGTYFPLCLRSQPHSRTQGWLLSFRPVFSQVLLVTHMHICETLGMTRGCPALGALAALVPGSPLSYLVHSSCQGWGRPVGPRPQDGNVFYSLHLVFMALPWAGRGGGSGFFFQSSV